MFPYIKFHQITNKNCDAFPQYEREIGQGEHGRL